MLLRKPGQLSNPRFVAWPLELGLGTHNPCFGVAPRVGVRDSQSTLRCGPSSADVMIWDQRGPSRTHGQFFDFEIGAHDGAYKGRLHTAVPYIGRKTLTDDQQEYNDVHGFYRARVGHLFARLWQWRIVCNVWTRTATELHGHVRILLHLTQFCIRRHTRYQPYGPWPHVPKSVWAQEEATVVEEENDDGVCCQLCGHHPGDISECGICHLNMCASCMPLHSCTL